MASRPFEEKQFGAREKELKEVLKSEKGEKNETAEKPEKDRKDQKDSPDDKRYKDAKDQKDSPDNKQKQEKEKHEKEQKPEKEHKAEKVEHKDYLEKERLRDKVQKDYEVQQFSQGPAPAAGAAMQADITALKLPHKEAKVEKFEIKEAKHEIKEIKIEKLEHKEQKLEKFEFKDHKIEFKEFKNEKLEFEYLPGSTDPGGPVEQRLAALEAAVTQLLHFIPENLRPDLTQGALKQEADAEKGAAKPAEPKVEPHQKGKS